MTDRAKALEEVELRVLRIEALNKALGPAEAVRFLAMFQRETTDYFEISKRLYEGQVVEDLFLRAENCLDE
jgi:hypothetical protein